MFEINLSSMKTLLCKALSKPVFYNRFDDFLLLDNVEIHTYICLASATTSEYNQLSTKQSSIDKPMILINKPWIGEDEKRDN